MSRLLKKAENTFKQPKKTRQLMHLKGRKAKKDSKDCKRNTRHSGTYA